MKLSTKKRVNGKINSRKQKNRLLIFPLSVVNSIRFMSEELLSFLLTVINAYTIHKLNLLLLIIVNVNGYLEIEVVSIINTLQKS